MHSFVQWFFFCKIEVLPQSKPDGFASSLWEGASGETGHFAVQPGTFPPCQGPHPRGGCRRRRLGEFAPVAYPFRQSLRLCHLPQGDGFSSGGKLCGSAERRPLGGAGERSETEGVLPVASILALSLAARLFPQETSAAPAVSLYDPSREKVILENPQIFQNCEIINNLSAEYAQSNAARIQNRPTRKRQICPPPFLCPQSVVY